MYLFSTRLSSALLFATLTISWTWNLSAHAAPGCCPHCGCHAECQKICRLVCEEKKVDVVIWGHKCEDFCLPDASKPGCKHCEVICNDAENAKDVCAEPKRHVWRDWIPTRCATMFTKAKLMKRTVSKKVPSYKWVVEDLCAECEKNCEPTNVPADASIPPVPNTDAKVIAPVQAPTPEPK